MSGVPIRIQLRRTRGWRLSDLSAHAVVVSRPSRWGNPFRVGTDVTITIADGQLEPWARIDPVAAVALYCRWLDHDLVDAPTVDVAALAGHDLACWCPLVDPRTGDRYPCHADVLLDLANLGRRP